MMGSNICQGRKLCFTRKLNFGSIVNHVFLLSKVELVRPIIAFITSDSFPAQKIRCQNGVTLPWASGNDMGGPPNWADKVR